MSRAKQVVRNARSCLLYLIKHLCLQNCVIRFLHLINMLLFSEVMIICVNIMMQTNYKVIKIFTSKAGIFSQYKKGEIILFSVSLFDCFYLFSLCDSIFRIINSCFQL